jgi:hypothetical protein
MWVATGRSGKALLAPVLLVGGAVMLSGCSQISALWKPEVAKCERYVRSAMKAPDSFKRHWYNVADLPVTRAVFAQATGSAEAAKSAPNPAIRKVYIQYYGDDGTRNEVIGIGSCYFALSDDHAGTYAQDVDAAVDSAVHENERRSLSISLGQPVGGADCCLVPGFDTGRLAKIKPIQRGKVSMARRM